MTLDYYFRMSKMALLGCHARNLPRSRTKHTHGTTINATTESNASIDNNIARRRQYVTASLFSNFTASLFYDCRAT